jgi:hypothetical protein
MQKSTIAWAVSALLSSAAQAAPATQFKEAFDGIGHMLVVPYYTVQSGNATLLNIVNTDKTNGKAVKLRFRGAANADTLFDFTLFLSPGDVWAAEVSQNPATGLARLYTPDNSCTLPTQVNGDFNTARTNPQADRPNETREGYIDIITMADVLPGTAVYTATKHVKGAPPIRCSEGVVVPVALRSLQTEAGIAAAGFGAPTTGLFANWSIFNVPEATSWSGKATAIAAVAADGKPGAGNVVMKPQTSDVPPGAAHDLTADPLLRSGAVQLVQSDLPDLSTPYIGSITPAQQAAQLSGVLAKTGLKNEYFTDDRVQAQTDWVFSMPMRRYSVALNPATLLPEYTVLSPEYVHAANSFVQGSAATKKVCTTVPDYGFWDRSEYYLDHDASSEDVELGVGIPMPRYRHFCGAVSVWSINAGDEFALSSLAARVSRSNLEIGYRDGWGHIAMPSINGAGTPLIGAAFSRATSTNIGNNISGNFGLAWEHRYVRPGDVIP